MTECRKWIEAIGLGILTMAGIAAFAIIGSLTAIGVEEAIKQFLQPS